MQQKSLTLEEFSPYIRNPVKIQPLNILRRIVQNKKKSQINTNVQIFKSTLTKKFFLLALYLTPFILFFILYGVLNFKFLQYFAYIPIGIGVLLSMVLIIFALSCLNRTITIDPLTIMYKTGSKEITIIRRNIRDIHLSKTFLYRLLRIGDGETDFTIIDTAFPRFNKIEEIAKGDKAARATQDNEYIV